MANNPVVNSLTFTGSVAGQASIQAQGIAGGLTFMLPNTSPIVGQLVTVTAVNGNSVFLGWESQQSLSNIPLTALSTSGATSGDVIQYNGTNWAVSSFVPGSGTVTSVAVTVPAWLAVAGSPITGAGTIAITSAPSLTANWVLATPNGSAGVLAPRALVAADIPSLPYLSSSTQLPVTFSPVAHEFLNSYTSSSGVFTAAQPDFSDLTGAVTIAQINSKRGNGTFVQLAASGTAGTAGDVVTFDANGNTVDSTVLLSSLAPLASPSFTGAASFATAVVDTNLRLGPSATLSDGGNSSGTSGQLLSSTSTATAWISQSALSVAFTQVTGTATKGQLPATTVYTDQGNTFAAGSQQVFNDGANLAFVNATDNTKSMHLDLSQIGASTDVAVVVPAANSWTAIPFTPVTHEFLTGFASGSFSAVQPASTDLSDAASLAYLASPTFTGTVTVGTGSNTVAVTPTSININANQAGNVGVTVTVTGNGADDIAEFFTSGVSPTEAIKIDPNANLYLITAGLGDHTGSLGSSTNVLTSTSSQVLWVAQSSLAIAGSQVSGNITGNATSITGSITESQVTGLTTDLAAKTVQYDGAGNPAAAGDNHIASGSGAITAGGTVTITLTGASVFADANYTVQVTRTSAVSGTGQLYAIVTSASQFNVNSSDNTDTSSTFFWTAIGI